MSCIIHTMHCKATMMVTWSFHFKDSGKEKRKKKLRKKHMCMCSGACTGRTQPKSYFIKFSNSFRTCKFICKRQPFHIVLNILLNQLLRLHVFEKFALTRALGSLYVYFSLNRLRILSSRSTNYLLCFFYTLADPCVPTRQKR